MQLISTLFFAPTLLSAFVQAASYRITDNWVGADFLNAFAWENIPDPTHGRVNYLSQSASLARNLTYARGNHFIMKADSTRVLSSNGPGRDSNRIISNRAYGHNTVLVADINHMPAGCGTWPALWTTQGDIWPDGGEIDILEGVNDKSPNAMTLHTSANCMMPASRLQTGTSTQTDCYWMTNSNTGCGVLDSKANSYGPSFNAAGGGWFAMERTPRFIRAWFWSRQDPNVPSQVRTLGQASINTDSWGTPTALFPNTNCDISSKFTAHNVIINLTFCGDWAGSRYSIDGCPGSCIDRVNSNPNSFTEAYWDIGAIRMYGL